MDAITAIARAKHKLAELRGGAVRCLPAGLLLGRHVNTLFGLVFLGLVMGAVAAVSIVAATNGRPDPRMDQVKIPLIGGSSLMTLALLGAAIAIVARAGTGSPQAALRNFYGQVGEGLNASQLVVPNDLDQMPRDLPELKGLGQAGSNVISDGATLAYYWNGLLRFIENPVVTTRISNFELRLVDPTTAVAKFDVGFKIKTKLPNSATIQIIEGLAALVGLDVKCGASFRMNKILFRSENGWRLLNGEFMGPEEIDTRWLERPDEPFGH